MGRAVHINERAYNKYKPDKIKNTDSNSNSIRFLRSMCHTQSEKDIIGEIYCRQ